jgi:DNA-binding winged helix-turn-helix (wHTH) protein/tetratricopeptide (TPR) repeat protein
MPQMDTPGGPGSPVEKVEMPSESAQKLLRGAMNGTEVYEFGPFRLDAAGPLLLRGAEPVPLTPKAAETLLVLVRRAGHVVGKEELIKEVWPDTFVEEGNLSNNVWTVRKALEDDGSASRYIETVPKRGYRFVADVRRVVVDDVGSAHEATPAVGAAGRPPVARRWIRVPFGPWVGALGVAVLLAGIGLVAFRARTPNAAATPTPEAGMAIEDVTAGRARVAVLPFENLTRQSDDDWLASAFSDSLTFGLQSLDSLILVSRTGIAQAYQAQSLREADRLEPEAIERLARALDVRYYVHGSYQRIGDQVRVVARLVEVDPGTIKAQESVTDRFVNLLQLEDALARRFAASLESGPVRARRRLETASLAAYRAITEGRGLYASGRWEAALESSQRAVDLDPDYAEAWALLGKTYARLASPPAFASGSLEDYRSRALTAAKRAVELDPSSYEAHVALGLAHREMAQIEPWRAAARKAIALNPRFAEAYALLGDSYSESTAWGCGHDRDSALAISYYRRALRIDPSVHTYHINLSQNLKYAGRIEDALRVVDEGLRMYPTSRGMRRARAWMLIELSRLDEAEQMLREAMADGGPRGDDPIHLAAINLKRGRLEAAANGFRNAVLSRRSVNVAHYYIQAGLPGPALDHLEQAFRAESACAQWLLTTPSSYWTPIRSNPQARALLEKYAGR